MATKESPAPLPPDVEDEGTGRRRSSPALLTSLSPRSWTSSVFGFVTEGRVRRRPSDVARLVSGLLVLAACGAWASRAGNLEQSTMDLLAQLPGSGRGLFRTTATLLVALGVAVGVAAVVRGHLRLAGTVLLAGVLAAAVAWVAIEGLDVDAARVAAGMINADGTVPEFPAAALAIGSSLVLAAMPYLTRPVRRIVATLIPLAGVGTVYLAQGLPSDVLAAIAVGWAAAAAAHLAFGTPAGTPSVGAVERTLAELGVPVTSLELAPIQTWGAARFDAEGEGRGRLAVRVIGRDATDATVIASLWQAIWYKDRAGGLVLGRTQRVEREAYVLLLAERAGVSVPTLLAAGSSGSRDDAVLVVDVPEGSSLADHDLWPSLLAAVTKARAEATEATLADRDAPPPEPVAVVAIDPAGLEGVVPAPDDVLDAMWATLAELHDARLVHGDISPENLLLQPDGRVVLLDFSRAGPMTEDLGRRLDRLAMLVAASRIAGPVAGVASAQRALGDDDLSDLLPLLQSSSLAAATRRRPAKAKLLIDAIRDETLQRTGVGEPELIELRRVSPADLLMAAATILGIYLLAGELTSVDDLWGTLTSAEPAWVLAVIFCSQMPQFTSAVTVIGAVHAPLPFGRVVMLQFANGFTGLVGGTAANTALIIRFFQKQGLSAGVALGSGILWSVAGFIAQVVLVTLCIFIARPDLGSVRMGGDTGGSGTPWLAYLLVVGGLLGILLAIPAVRRSLALKVKPQVHEIRRNLRGVLSEPRKAAQLFGGAFGSQIFFALSLDSAVHAYGGSVAFSSVVLTNSFASLVGGLAPIPGGMGVTEAGMIAGLTAAGVPQETAVAATLLHRTFTYYLPPIWGWGALRWLKNHDAV